MTGAEVGMAVAVMASIVAIMGPRGIDRSVVKPSYGQGFHLPH